MRLLLNPYVLAGIALLLLATGAAGYRAGHGRAADACAADKTAALARAIAQAEAVARQDAEVLAGHEQRRERLRTVFQPIREGVTRYAQDHAGADRECLDPDGMRLWLAANSGRPATAAAAQPDRALSGSAAAALRARGGSAGQPRAGGGALPRMPGAAAGAGGVGEQ